MFDFWLVLKKIFNGFHLSGDNKFMLVEIAFKVLDDFIEGQMAQI
jgi:hypothetical protein